MDPRRTFSSRSPSRRPSAVTSSYSPACRSRGSNRSSATSTSRSASSTQTPSTHSGASARRSSSPSTSPPKATSHPTHQAPTDRRRRAVRPAGRELRHALERPRRDPHPPPTTQRIPHQRRRTRRRARDGSHSTQRAGHRTLDSERWLYAREIHLSERERQRRSASMNEGACAGAGADTVAAAAFGFIERAVSPREHRVIVKPLRT